jgi:hypothetical protein
VRADVPLVDQALDALHVNVIVTSWVAYSSHPEEIVAPFSGESDHLNVNMASARRPRVRLTGGEAMCKDVDVRTCTYVHNTGRG